MKILEEVRERITTELPHCKTHDDVLQLFKESQHALVESRAPFGQKRHMWEELKSNLSNLSRRPEVVNDAHSIIDAILKRGT